MPTDNNNNNNNNSNNNSNSALPPSFQPPRDTSTDQSWQMGKGFLAGALFASLNRHLIMGVLVGTAAGMFIQQEIGAPDVKTTINHWKSIVQEALNKGK